MAIKKVTLVGANGRLGPAFLSAFFTAKSFDISVISRKSSKSIYAREVNTIHISDEPDTDELVQVLQGQDALVVIFTGTIDKLQLRLADAAVQAGVKRFIPADFGSCDSNSPHALDLIPLYRNKQNVRQHLQSLASGNRNFSWTSLVCGHFFDLLLSFDLKASKATIFDGGDIKWSTTTIATIATAVVRILQKEEETRNRMLYIQSFNVTQNEVLASLEKATGEKWQAEQVNSEDFIKENKARTDKDPNDAEATEHLVSVEGIVDANWENKDDFANQLLGLAGDDLDEEVKKVVATI